VLIAGFCAVFVSWLALKIAGHATVVTGDNVLQAVGEAMGFLFALPLFTRTVTSHRQRLASWLLALGILSYCIGQALWTVNEDVLHLAVLFPSWADAGGLASFQRLVAEPLALARHLDDAEYLAQVQAVERFHGAMSAYRGRTYGQLYPRLVPGNALAGGGLAVSTGAWSIGLSFDYLYANSGNTSEEGTLTLLGRI